MTMQQFEPYRRYVRESLSFLGGILYLSAVRTTALSAPESKLGKLHVEFSRQVKDDYGDPEEYFIAQLFVAKIASFEVFLQETISLVIQKNPKKVGAIEFKLAEILDCSDVTLLVQRAAEEFLNKLMYKKPSEYLVALCELMSIEHAPLQVDWAEFVEAKARRDLGLHNAWKCNQIYIRKLDEIGIPPQLQIGELAHPKELKYVRDINDALARLADTITNLMLAKHWPELTIRVGFDASKSENR